MKKLLAAVMACAVALACPFSLAACRVEEYSSLVRYYNKFDTTARLVVTADFADEANMRRLSELGTAGGRRSGATNKSRWGGGE